MQPLSSEKLAYLAGLFDGEGSLQLRKHKVNKRKSIHFYLRTVIKMEAGDWEDIPRATGIGRFYTERSHSDYKMTAWYIYKKRDVWDFLHAILPYVKVKKEKIKRTLELLNYCGVYKRNLTWFRSREAQRILSEAAPEFWSFHKRKRMLADNQFNLRPSRTLKMQSRLWET